MGPAGKRRKLSSKQSSGPVEEEIKFDDAARHEFLTGFHKRKLQRAKHAQEAAERRMKEERREARKRLREERQAELRRMFEEHQARMKEISGTASDSDAEERGPSSQDGNQGAEEEVEEDAEWTGFDEPEPVDHTAEYIDEDKFTTVTVEEVDDIRDGFGSASDTEDEASTSKHPGVGEGEGDEHASATDAKAEGKNRPKRPWSQDTPEKTRRLKKKRNFRYESKVERKVTRYKEKTGNRKKAKERRTR
ncbi:hypothetical protein KEM52_006234 [Ascosphaera acerosa]|nr:hypothetical protein KEM52_006234 [Ascosphaera acerosa]